MIDVGAIGQDHVGKGALVLVEAVRLEHDFFPKGEGRGGVLGSLAERLAPFRAVDAAEADTLCSAVVEKVYRIGLVQAFVGH